MATIVLAWELGGGLGHLMNLRPLAEGLSQRGHRVVAIVRDVAAARKVFREMQVSVLQAPLKTARPEQINPICTFAQILHDSGFGDPNELAALAAAWRNLFELLRPDLIVFEHSPTAFLASAGLTVWRALIGTGFTNPPDLSPYPNLRTWIQPNAEILAKHEDEVLANMNRALVDWKQKPLERVGRLYGAADENILLTLPELDCYPRAGDVAYYGPATAGIGSPPDWPPGRGRKVFVYLKPFPALRQLITTLGQLPNPTLIYAPDINPAWRQECRSPSVRFLDAPVEMQRVAQECDLAILNGTNATTLAMLLAGKPALHIPIFLEQALNARAAQRCDAAICVSGDDPHPIMMALRAMLTSNFYTNAAEAFAKRYANLDSERQVERLVDTGERLAAGR